MDRFYRGLVAGIAGGILMDVISLFSYHILHFATRRYIDWASVLMYGHLPQNLVQTLISLIAQLLWAGVLGVVFAYLIPTMTSRVYLIKGAVWGFLAGFLQYGLATLIKMPYFTIISHGTVITQIIGAIVWGLTSAYVLRRLDTTPIER